MEITTTAGLAGGETTGHAQKEEQNERFNGGSGDIEKGSGYGPPGEGSGKTVPHEKDKEQTDEIGGELETGDEVNDAIEQQGDDAAAGITRDTDAAKHQHDPGA